MWWKKKRPSMLLDSKPVKTDLEIPDFLQKQNQPKAKPSKNVKKLKIRITKDVDRLLPDDELDIPNFLERQRS